MRHMAKIKKKPKLNTFAYTNLLHSKSTYFYKQRWNSYLVPAMCAMALLLVIGCMINPFAQSSGGERVYASKVPPETIGSTDTTTMSVSLMMADPDKTLLQQNAKAGEMSYISSEFTVTTENVDGYNVYVQTAPGSTNKLTNGNITIDFVTTETPTSNFTDNTWGYAVDDTGATVENLKYNPIPDTASIMNPAYTSNSTGETRNFTLNFATKFAKDATPGHYTSGVLLSVAAGAGEVVNGFNGITKMQEMVASVCHSAPFGEEGQLTDTRDNKTYWIAKLSDGNCWMTQNLDLDLNTSKPLLSVDSDLPSSWTPSENTQTSANPNFDTTNNNIKSWNPGANGGEKYCNTSGCNLTTSTNNGHDAQGNYYSWGAATAGQAASLTSSTAGEQATQSICPKGWRLPTGGNNGEFYVAFNGMTVADLITKPYYFVYGGLVSNSFLGSAGSVGYYWSSTANDSYYAYFLYFDTNVNPSNNWGRYGGFSVRCVAR